MRILWPSLIASYVIAMACGAAAGNAWADESWVWMGIFLVLALFFLCDGIHEYITLKAERKAENSNPSP
jgi:hypothetical protein